MAEAPPEKGQIAVILVAAGRGSRAGDGIPKQYRLLFGKTVIRRTVEAFLNAFSGHEAGVRIVPVIHPDDAGVYEQSVAGLEGLDAPVFGGATRQDSVRNGLEALGNNPPLIVHIHDAARPFISPHMIKELTMAIDDKCKGVTPALNIVDTLVRKSAEGHTEAVDRDSLFAVQTPQVFVFNEILQAHRTAAHNRYTDDASLFEASGGKIKFINGDPDNFKITTANDFMKANRMLAGNLTDVRVGAGYDVHRFEPGDHVWLGGVKIPHNQSLKGHSDADVALHALTDAVLAAIADGDIGTHFSPSDETWRGAASNAFLSHACERVNAKGGLIAHLAVIIICEAPKIGPHSTAMRETIAQIAGIDISRVSVQATTTEKLGFTGRGEGIAAQATATVRLPEAEGGL